MAGALAQPRGRVPVVIVGAGPTGLAAAHLLALRGVGCVIVERELAPYPLPRALHFDDEVFRIFQAMGLEAELQAATRSIPGMQLLDAQHRVINEFPRVTEGGHHGFPEGNFFDQPELEALMRRALERLAHVRLLGGHEMLAVEQDRTDGPAPVRVTLRERAGGAVLELWAQFVLGCDGARSLMRSFVGAETQDLRFDESWLVVDVRTPEPLACWEGVQHLCDPSRPATSIPLARGRHRWEFMLMPGDVPAEMATPARVQSLVAPWLQGADAEKIEVIRRAVYTFHALVARRWRRGRLFLLGDAAHQTPPFLGQGLCAGIRDAANLAWKLALVLEGRADLGLLDSYQAEREPHVRRLIWMAVGIGSAMTGRGGGAAGKLIAALARSRRITGRFTHVAFPPLRPGPLVRRRRPRPLRDAAGHPLPQPWVVTQDGVRRRLDALLGDGFAVVAAGIDPAAGLGEDRAFWEALPARFLRIEPGLHGAQAGSPGVTSAADDAGMLARWLARRGARAALVRPDRIVCAAAKEPQLQRWRRALCEVGIAPAPRR